MTETLVPVPYVVIALEGINHTVALPLSIVEFSFVDVIYFNTSFTFRDELNPSSALTTFFLSICVPATNIELTAIVPQNMLLLVREVYAISIFLDC